MGLTVIADDEEDRTNRRKEIAQGDASFNNFLSSDVGGRGAVVSTVSGGGGGGIKSSHATVA
ncbi:hypothetical protein U1Q18_045154, partial [Sarracenia purpurea var. burkii]